MDVLICPDKFKGSLSALQVCQAIRAGILRHSPTTRVSCHPLSDGGDGMLDVLASSIAMHTETVEVSDPLFRPVMAQYGISASGDTAYIEMSRASGLVLLQPDERNVLETTTLGTGELIRDALRHKVKKIVLGIGGSATNDAGMGVASALGYRFLDCDGNELSPIGKSLCRVDSIDTHSVVAELASVMLVVASDVQNPFFGRDGAAQTFAKQKGADDAAIGLLDNGLENFARVVEKDLGVNLQRIAGAGAAGKYNKPVAVLCGSTALASDRMKQMGIFYSDAIMKDGLTLHDAMTNGYRYLEGCAYTLLASIDVPGKSAS